MGTMRCEQGAKDNKTHLIGLSARCNTFHDDFPEEYAPAHVGIMEAS